MTSTVVPICYSCDRFIDGIRRACSAFPDGIPDAIWESRADHRNPFKGDQALQFIQDEDQPAPAFGMKLYDFELTDAERG